MDRTHRTQQEARLSRSRQTAHGLRALLLGRRSAPAAIAGLLAVLLFAPACALFNSSGSLSDSSGSFSDSSGSFSDSSTSSSGDDDDYRRDVQSFTRSHVEAKGSPEALRLGLSDVALTRGISDWEAVPGTFVAAGIALAQVELPTQERLAYQHALAPPGSANSLTIAAAIQQAIEAGASDPTLQSAQDAADPAQR